MMQLQVHQLRPPETALSSLYSTQIQSFLFCLLMTDLLPGAPRVLRFWISAELGGPSTSWKFAHPGSLHVLEVCITQPFLQP